MHVCVPRAVYFFMEPAPPELYPLSLHDALPISREPTRDFARRARAGVASHFRRAGRFDEPVEQDRITVGLHLAQDRKSTRLNSSHTVISYAVFCLKKKRPGASPQRPPATARGR